MPRAQSPAASGWTVTDDSGTAVAITATPERVISLSPANTEIAFALGAGDRLVGGTDFDDFPAEAAALPDVATYEGVLMEQLVALEPDLVLAVGQGPHPRCGHRPDARPRLPGGRACIPETWMTCSRTSGSSAAPSAATRLRPRTR